MYMVHVVFMSEREQQYVHMKSQQKIRNMQMAARLMVRGGCLPVRGSKGMEI